MAEISLLEPFSSTDPRAHVKLVGSTAARDGRLSDDDFLVILNFSRSYRFDSYLEDPTGRRLAKSTDKPASDLRVQLDLDQIGALQEARGREAIHGVFEQWPVSAEERRRLTDEVLRETRASLVVTRLHGGDNVIHVSFRATLVWEFYFGQPSSDKIL